jgi:hypothetical protein
MARVGAGPRLYPLLPPAFNFLRDLNKT